MNLSGRHSGTAVKNRHGVCCRARAVSLCHLHQHRYPRRTGRVKERVSTQKLKMLTRHHGLPTFMLRECNNRTTYVFNVLIGPMFRKKLDNNVNDS